MLFFFLLVLSSVLAFPVTDFKFNDTELKQAKQVATTGVCNLVYIRHNLNQLNRIVYSRNGNKDQIISYLKAKSDSIYLGRYLNKELFPNDYIEPMDSSEYHHFTRTLILRSTYSDPWVKVFDRIRDFKKWFLQFEDLVSLKVKDLFTGSSGFLSDFTEKEHLQPLSDWISDLTLQIEHVKSEFQENFKKEITLNTAPDCDSYFELKITAKNVGKIKKFIKSLINL